MMKNLITVLTPTYNRAYILPQLYESLCRQTCREFEWMIVDDGSEDETKDLVEKWETEQNVIIHYIYQKNGGKHRAHNTGVKACDTELIMICDSDDYLLDDAIEKVSKAWKPISSKNNIGGIIAYRGQFVDGKLQTSKGLPFPEVEEEATVTEIFEN